MVIRVLAVPDYLDLLSFDVGRVWATSFAFTDRSSIAFAAESKRLREFQLRPQEKFLYTCGAIDLWEWELRLLDREDGADGDKVPICLAGRGAAPPECCGGPTGYRLMLRRQREGKSMCTHVRVEMVIGMISAAHPDQPTDTWDLLRQTVDKGYKSIDQRL
jgi:hypothetical protein